MFISWQLFDGDEGKPITLSCSSSSKNVNSFDSAEVKWYKVNDTGDSFELKELKPVVRNKSNIKGEEIKTGQVYWTSDLKEPDWSITIDSLELDDEALYQCDISTGSEKESVLMELVVNRKLCHVHPSVHPSLHPFLHPFIPFSTLTLLF